MVRSLNSIFDELTIQPLNLTINSRLAFCVSFSRFIILMHI